MLPVEKSENMKQSLPQFSWLQDLQDLCLSLEAEGLQELCERLEVDFCTCHVDTKDGFQLETFYGIHFDHLRSFW